MFKWTNWFEDVSAPNAAYHIITIGGSALTLGIADDYTIALLLLIILFNIFVVQFLRDQIRNQHKK